MKNNLKALIESLELGTKLNIGVYFFNTYGNEKTELPFEKTIRSSVICNTAKSTPESYSECFRCRNKVMKMIVKKKRSIAGFCTKGVFEYSRPIILDNSVIGIIFIYNILTNSSKQIERLTQNFESSLLSTMQTDFTIADCERTADIIESYIMYLLEKYNYCTNSSQNNITEKIKNYIKENYLYDFSMSDLSYIFGYNEKYLGRLFKQDTNLTVKEYVNLVKLEKAKELLETTKMNVTEISQKTGFNNVTYFNRVFKRAQGLSPTKYRASFF